jgi:hypothetical protein
MLARLLDDDAGRFAAISLSVRSDNPARRLYARLGFRLVDDGGAQQPGRRHLGDDGPIARSTQ